MDIENVLLPLMVWMSDGSHLMYILVTTYCFTADEIEYVVVAGMMGAAT